MSQLRTLQSASSLRDVANLLHIRPANLSYILYHLRPETKYSTFAIPKRNGGTRIIMAPAEPLKIVQKRLSVLLQDCLDENQTRKDNDRIAHGFKRRRSIITNAKQHRHRRYVFNVDLSDFFPSINFGRVRGYFIHDSHFSLHAKVATVIAQIACHENALPQGSPSSPVISNLIAHVMDVHLVRLSLRVGCMYSRYADDLTFSTNKRIFPSEIATSADGDPHNWNPGNELLNIVVRSGFALNDSKIHMQYQTSRQVVTGLVVNRRINVRREYRHLVRAMVHNLFTNGAFEISRHTKSNGVDTIKKRPGTMNELQGMLGFIRGVDLYNLRAPYPDLAINELPEEVKKKIQNREAMYRSFLFYRNFFVPDKPVIVCEGKTDVIYLRCAIKNLADDFPRLATKKPDGTVELNVRLYDRPSGTARIMGMDSGGSGNLASFINTFRKEANKLHGPERQHPVILLYDNDKGAESVQRAMKKKPPEGRDSEYCCVLKNLYAVPTPLHAGEEESEIEDFFDSTTKKALIRGKTFSSAREIDPNTEYGKKDFANAVGRRWKSIDFDGFRSLLQLFTCVIAAHAKTTEEV